MMQKENKIMVAQMKGLLMGLEDEIRTVRFNLAVDNLENLGNEIASFQDYIDAMSQALCMYKEIFETEKGDELL